MIRLILSLNLALLLSCTTAHKEGASSLSSSSASYSHCEQIVSNGIHDVSNSTDDLNLKKYEADKTCSAINKYGSNYAKNFRDECKSIHDYISTASSYYDYQERKKSSNTDVDTDGSFSYFFEAGGSADGSQSSSSAEIDAQGGWNRSVSQKKYDWCLKVEDVQKKVDSFKSTHCGSKVRDYSESRYLHTFLQKVNPQVVQAWASCVAANNGGLIAYGSEGNGYIDLTIIYDKPPFAPSALEIIWATDNLQAIGSSASLPAIQYEGNQTVSMKRLDSNAPAKVTINAFASSYVSSYTYDIAAKPETLKCVDTNLVGVQTGEIYELNSGHCQPDPNN